MKEEHLDSYLAMWCSEGLECIINVTEIEREDIINVLNDKPKRGVPLNQMLLRARFNSQRFYEIYAFSSELTKQELEGMFESDPQTIVDAIRECGKQLYSERRPEDRVIIR
jgi:hypothetical protein